MRIEIRDDIDIRRLQVLHQLCQSHVAIHKDDKRTKIEVTHEVVQLQAIVFSLMGTHARVRFTNDEVKHRGMLAHNIGQCPERVLDAFVGIDEPKRGENQPIGKTQFGFGTRAHR